MKSNDTPILNTLNDYLSRNPIRMHVPFHGGISNSNVFPSEIYNLDVSEISGYDIGGEDNPVFQSEKITANYFNVEHSFYLTGGASVGLLAAMIALNKHGKKVILARNVHKSVINGVILAGLEPIWLDVDFLNEWGIFSKIDLNKLENIFSEEKNIAGCVIVSPTYEGVISDVEAIAMICHSKNIPLIVDEAHGAHLYFVGACHGMPLQSADVVIQSWHKSLGSLTQSGVLHLVNNNYFSYQDIKRSLDLVSSTSSSFLLLLSLELTRKHFVETHGHASLRSLLQESISFREEIKQIQDLILFQSDDPFKIYIKHKNISGVDFAYLLYKKYSIEIESANYIGFLMLIGRNFNDEIKNKMLFALNKISNCRGAPWRAPTGKMSKPQIQQSNVLPRDAFILGFKNNQNLEYGCNVEAPCPPGYAINIPGTKKCFYLPPARS